MGNSKTGSKQPPAVEGVCPGLYAPPGVKRSIYTMLPLEVNAKFQWKVTETKRNIAKMSFTVDGRKITDYKNGERK